MRRPDGSGRVAELRRWRHDKVRCVPGVGAAGGRAVGKQGRRRASRGERLCSGGGLQHDDRRWPAGRGCPPHLPGKRRRTAGRDLAGLGGLPRPRVVGLSRAPRGGSRWTYRSAALRRHCRDRQPGDRGQRRAPHRRYPKRVADPGRRGVRAAGGRGWTGPHLGHLRRPRRRLRRARAALVRHQGGRRLPHRAGLDLLHRGRGIAPTATSP